MLPKVAGAAAQIMFVSNRVPDMISVLLRQNVEQGQSQKQVSVVTVMGDRGIVHCQKCNSYG
jgi:hypothetical protein